MINLLNFHAHVDPFSEHVEQDLDEGEIEKLKKIFSQPLSYRRDEVTPSFGGVVSCTSIAHCIFLINSILPWDWFPRQHACPRETLPLPAVLEVH